MAPDVKTIGIAGRHGLTDRPLGKTAADDPALLQGDDDLWVEVPVALGEGAWIAGDDVEDFGRLGI